MTFAHLPSTDVSGNSRGHWSKLYRAKKALGEETWALLQEQGLLDTGDGNPGAMERAKVTYHAHWCGVAPDADNLIIGGKAILDAIVDEKLLRSDSPAHVTIAEVQYTRVPHRRDVRFVVTLEAM